MRRLGAVVSLILLAGSGEAGEASLQAGAYAIRHRLELPHVERWAVERIDVACIPETLGSEPPEPMLPILSANMPFKRCIAKAWQLSDRRLDYDIVCPGRGAAKAHASYVLSGDGFTGRIFMTMGAKNMTMTEVQSGRRLGSCAVASR
jgi:hypothetical protein